MPPQKPTSPKSPDSPSEEQGAFFGVNVSKATPNGLTDAEGFSAKPGDVTIVYPENGVYYPEEATETSEDTGTPIEEVQTEVARAKETKRNRRLGNTGLHTSRHSETGSYSDGLRLGAFLPGFGPVKERNWEDAKEFARRLDSKRLAREVESPMLNTDTPHDIHPVVEAIAAAHDIEQVLAEEPQEPKRDEPQPEATQESTAPQITSEQKLAIIQEKAGFVPTTHDEKNTAIGLIFSAAERGGDWAHSYLMETYNHLVKHYTGTEGLSLHASKLKASEGVVSRINEMGDYFHESIDDGKALQWLQNKLDETMNPALTLEEAILDSYEPVDEDEDQQIKDEMTMLWAVAAIVRYYDYDTHQNLPFLPMTEREDRSIDTNKEGKNKQLYNPYVAAFMLSDHRPEISDKYAVISKHIVDQTRTITVQELRALVPRALEDQRNRYRFWLQALKDMKGPYKKIAKQRIDNWVIHV